MFELIKLPIVGGNTNEVHGIIDPAQTINLYQINHPKVRFLRQMPGLSDVSVILTGKSNVRQLYVKNNKLYAVAEDTIYQIEPNLSVSILGTINTLSGYVGISSNQTQIIFVDGSEGYTFDLISTVFAEILDADFPAAPIDVTFQDGFFIVADGNTNKWAISSLNDGTTWDALDFERIESRPDLINGIRNLHRTLFIFGFESTEPWYNAGQTDFPFRRNNSLLLEYGAAARGAIARGHERLFWLGGDRHGVGSIFMTDGTQPIRISTPALDAEIQTYSDIDNARGYVFKYDGHLFYEINFTGGNATWTYDVSLNQWYRRQASNGDRFAADCHAFFNGKHYVGAYNAGEIYEMSDTHYRYIDKALRCVRITEPFKDPKGRKILINQLIVDILPGQGKANQPDADPELLVSWSKQGGTTGTFELIQRVQLGKIGKFDKKLTIDRLGAAGGDEGLSWVFKFEFSGDVPFLLGDATAKVEILSI